MNTEPNPNDPRPPENLTNLAENINDILDSISLHKGEVYTDLLLRFFTLKQQIEQLEEIGCECTGEIKKLLGILMKDQIEASPELDSIQNKYDATSLKHEAVHMLASAALTTLDSFISLTDKNPAFKGFAKDVEILMQRVQSDWKNRRGNHTS